MCSPPCQGLLSRTTLIVLQGGITDIAIHASLTINSTHTEMSRLFHFPSRNYKIYFIACEILVISLVTGDDVVEAVLTMYAMYIVVKFESICIRPD